MRTIRCPSNVELIDYRDGQLVVDRHNEITRHLAICAACHERVRASNEIGRLLRAHAPAPEDSVGVEAALARVHAENAELNRQAVDLQRGRPLLGGVAVILLIVGFLLPTVTALAGVPLDDVVERVASSVNGGRESPSATTTPVMQRPAAVRMSDVPFLAAILPALPEDFRLIQQHASSGIMSLRYTDDQGRVIDVRQSLATTRSKVSDAGRSETVLVDGVDVEIEHGGDDVVSRLLWVQGDTFFELTVIHVASTGLSETELLAIARAFITTLLIP